MSSRVSSISTPGLRDLRLRGLVPGLACPWLRLAAGEVEICRGHQGALCVRRRHGDNGEVCVAVYKIHGAYLRYSVRFRILHDTKRVNPKVVLAKCFAHCHGI